MRRTLTVERQALVAERLHHDLPQFLHILRGGCCLINCFVRFPANCEFESVRSSRPAKGD